jgi:hypothetical protein
LTNGDEECLHHAIPELWHVEEVSPKELKFILKIYVGMVQPEIILIIPFGIINMNLENH